MARRGFKIYESSRYRRNLQDVPNPQDSTSLQDITRALSCIDARVQDAVESFEEGISMVRNLTEQISELKEFVTKETTDLRRRCVEMENNDACSQNGIWRFPWNTGRKNTDDCNLLRE